MSLAVVKDLAVIFGTVIALAVLVKGVFEYSRDAAKRRLEILLELRNRFTDNPALQQVRTALESDDPNALRQVSKNSRVDFAVFVEEIAIMLNSKLISPFLAHSLFGFYAMKANESPGFWEGFHLEQNQLYWAPFTEFAKDMKAFAEKHPRYIKSKNRV